jgi:lysyl endopeptidase
MKHLLTVITALLSFTLVISAANQVSMEKSPGQFDPAQYVAAQQELYHRLLSEAAPLSARTIYSIYVSEEEMTEVDRYSCETCGRNLKLRVGLHKPINVDVDFEDVNFARISGAAHLGANGMMRATHDGFIWTAAVESPKATALRIHFSGFSLPTGSNLYVYNLEGEAFGPYRELGPNGTGDFWSHTVTGGVAYVQVVHSGPVTRQILEASHFVIADIAHLGEKFLLPFLKKDRSQRDMNNLAGVEALCSFNADCVEDAECYDSSDWGAIEDARLAIAHMQFVEGPWIYICTGGLLADTVTSSQIPYFLTANHCLSTESIADTLECYWQFWTSSCGGACYNPVGVVPRTVGAALLSTNSVGDYTLLLLDESPPAGSVYLGWYNTAVAFDHGYQLYRISHPQGAPQAFSRHQVDTTKITCSGWPRGERIYSHDLIGATEGGSSGSPVLNATGQVVGQLTGACGYNLNDPCDSESNGTVDGAFAYYSAAIMPWLDPGSASIILSLQQIKSKGVKYVKLTWTGAVGTNVNIYRNGSLLVTTTNDGEYTDDLGKRPSGTYTYKVCETDASACSNEPSVTY